jgi:hypothetical protein
MKRREWALVAGAGVCAGCATLLSIPNDTPSFCAQPANEGHAYCEDFDVGDPSTRWSFAEQTDASTYAIEPFGLSPPNCIDLATLAQPAGSGSIAGFDKEFDDSTFVGLHIEADVRFVVPADAGLPLSSGFLLITDKSGGCVGIGVGDGVVGAQVYTEPAECPPTLNNDGPANDASAPPTVVMLGKFPPINQWLHMIVVVTPAAAGDGSGTLTFDIVGEPSGSPPVMLPPGTFPTAGVPLVGFASNVNGPSPGLDVQFDNVTIDLRGS